MNHTAFFNAIRSLFGGSMTQGQVDGCETLLAACVGMPTSHAAYTLATALHETARTMQPISERGGIAYFWRMYDPQGTRPGVAKALGNTKPGDGARFHGRGYVQLTGRANYAKASAALGVDLIADPERAKHPAIASRIMARGMREGWFSGRKLSDYLPGDYVAARKIINGSDCAQAIAHHAAAFEFALDAAGWGRVDPPATAQTDKPAPAPETGLFAAIIEAVKGMMKWN